MPVFLTERQARLLVGACKERQREAAVLRANLGHSEASPAHVFYVRLENEWHELELILERHMRTPRQWRRARR